jgi:hypothetical protein
MFAEHFNLVEQIQHWNTVRTEQVEELKSKPDYTKTSKKQIIGQNSLLFF